MNTETINLTQVNVNAKNPRKISDPQLQRLVKSLLVFPEMLQLRPIVVDETNTALGGNMRYRALTAITTMSADEIRETLETSLAVDRLLACIRGEAPQQTLIRIPVHLELRESSL